jgi:hypothetical protein
LSLFENKKKDLCKSLKCDENENLVCGSDGKTYINECILNLTACNSKLGIHVLHSGSCESKTDSKMSKTLNF